MNSLLVLLCGALPLHSDDFGKVNKVYKENCSMMILIDVCSFLICGCHYSKQIEVVDVFLFLFIISTFITRNFTLLSIILIGL